MAGHAALTETWGLPMSEDQRAMALRRYALAADFAKGSDVLEVGCGAGLGLAALEPHAARVVGGDITAENLLRCRERLPSSVLARLDARLLPFVGASFDAVLLFEVLYYVVDLEGAVAECARVLRPGGTVVASMPNPAAAGFHASPLSHEYCDAQRLGELFCSAGFAARVFGAFAIPSVSRRGRVVLWLTRLAEALRVVPKTLEGRARLKRVLFGSMEAFSGLDLGAPPEPLVELVDEDQARQFRMLYLIGSTAGDRSI